MPGSKLNNDIENVVLPYALNTLPAGALFCNFFSNFRQTLEMAETDPVDSKNFWLMAK